MCFGKVHQVIIPSERQQIYKYTNLIHTDVSGLMSHVSLGGYEYYVIFIDDYSRRTWIYFLETKGEVFSCFKEFKALVEKQTGRKIWVL